MATGRQRTAIGAGSATAALAHKLTQKKRDRLKPSTFGLPGQRAYPMPDKAHASLAEGDAKKELAKGNLTRSQYDQIVAKAKQKLGGSS